MACPRRVKAAVIGCGEISEIYLENLTRYFHLVEVVGCSDIISGRAQLRAGQFGLRVMTNEEIYLDPEIELVLNLTYPTSHYEVTKAALLAGKHVYTEKMLAVKLEEGEELAALAREKRLWLTTGPDTCLGGGLQTARYLIDSGMIGTPVMALGFCPRSYPLDRPDDVVRMIHLPGGGIPFDMGGYYLHAFINFFGSIRRAGGFMQIRHQERRFFHPRSPLYGEEHKELSPNTMTANLEFASGVLGCLMMTSECDAGAEEKMEIIGTEGSLFVHDPNFFGGRIALKRTGNAAPMEMPYTHAFHEQNLRGLGAVDLAWAIRTGRKPRLEAAIGLQAFEVIHRVWQSAEDGQIHPIAHQLERPEAMPRTSLIGSCAECVLDK